MRPTRFRPKRRRRVVNGSSEGVEHRRPVYGVVGIVPPIPETRVPCHILEQDGNRPAGGGVAGVVGKVFAHANIVHARLFNGEHGKYVAVKSAFRRFFEKRLAIRVVKPHQQVSGGASRGKTICIPAFGRKAEQTFVDYVVDVAASRRYDVSRRKPRCLPWHKHGRNVLGRQTSAFAGAAYCKGRVPCMDAQVVVTGLKWSDSD